VRRASGHGRALEHHAPADDLRIVGAEKAGDRAQRRRLAGAVGTEQRHDLGGRNAKRHTLDRGRDAVVDDLQVLELEQRRRDVERRAHDAERSGR
jgi:hypothetical protein